MRTGQGRRKGDGSGNVRNYITLASQSQMSQLSCRTERCSYGTITGRLRHSTVFDGTVQFCILFLGGWRYQKPTILSLDGCTSRGNTPPRYTVYCSGRLLRGSSIHSGTPINYWTTHGFCPLNILYSHGFHANWCSGA